MIKPNLVRNISCLLFALFLAVPTSVVSQSIENQEDERRARIWREAISWIYNDNNDRTGNNYNLPDLKYNTTEEFEKSLRAARDKNLEKYNFYEQIYIKVDNKASTDTELISLITEAAVRKNRDIESLKKELERVAGKALESEPSSEALTTASNAYSSDSYETPNIHAEPNTIDATNSSERESQVGFPFYSGTTALVLGGLSLLLSIFCIYLISGHESVVRRIIRENRDKEPNPLFNQSSLTANLERSMSREIQSLERKVKEIESAFENRLRKVELLTPNSQKNENYFNPAPATQATPEYKPVVSLKKYAHLPEDGLIKEKDILDNNTSNAYIELTLPYAHSETLSFRINPDSTHKLAINNSQERLKAFFDIYQNSNEVSRIVNVGDGKLIKTPQGWKMETKAKVKFE